VQVTPAVQQAVNENGRAVQSAASNVIDQAQAALNEAQGQAETRLNEAMDAAQQTAEDVEQVKADELKAKLNEKASGLF